MRRLLPLILAVLAILGVTPAHASVGFARITFVDQNGETQEGGVWYPAAAPATRQRVGPFEQTVAGNAPVIGHRLPLVLISHGGGGTFASHYDTALALARAGFVVAAISHAGDSGADQSQVLKLWRRPAQLRRLTSFMLDEWPDRSRLDPGRVGAFGFSNGGFTVLVAAGGVPDLRRIDPYCRVHPDHDLCQALRHAGVTSVEGLAATVPADAWRPDPRIKAIAIAAPAFGFTFSHEGLAAVTIPVQLWRAADDRHQPNPFYEEMIRPQLPRPPEYHVVKGAGHYDFLPPCTPQLAAIAPPEVCADPTGFDRAAFHRSLDAEIVKFFRRHLR